MATPEAIPADRRPGRAAWVGLAAALVLILAAVVAPQVFGWEVHARSNPDLAVPPLHSKWHPNLGSSTVAALLLALVGWRYATTSAERLPWRLLLLASYLVGLAWLLALALADGEAGLTRALGNSHEYLETARQITDIPLMLQDYVSRIPYSAPDNWPTHVAGHPPGALLVFVLLDRIGLGGDLAAGVVVTLVAATTIPAVLTTLRALGAEQAARRAAPFLVLGPTAVFMAVSADALFTAAAAWGLAALALAATRNRRFAVVGWAALAGVLLGYTVMMSYGLPLLGLLALAILHRARSWLPLPVAVAAASAVVLAFAAADFRLWEAYPVLQQRYWDGIASDRPAAYWMWGNLAALALSAGPALGAGLGALAGLRRRAEPNVGLLVAAAAGAIVLADLSRLSKGEVERIWLPFIPWLLLATALLPERWRRPALALQLLTALLLQHLLYTSW